MITPSQGIHLIFDASFLPGNSAVMVPHTSDGRVLFAIPWHGHTLVEPPTRPLHPQRSSPLPKSRKSSSFWQPPENIWRKRRPATMC